MTDTELGYDISKGNLWATVTKNALSKSRVEQVIDQVYDEFSCDAPIQTHLIEFSAWHQLQSAGNPDLSALARFEYLRAASTDTSALRTKGFIAINMICAEIDEGELSAQLIEPFANVTILPQLYRRWQAHRSGLTKPPLSL